MATEVDQTSELMRRYAQGENVFDQLYALMTPRLYRFCQHLARDKPDGDDLFQETFLKLHRARATYLPGANALHWAFAIARSAHIDRLRYRRRRPEDPGATHDAAEDNGLPADQRSSPEAAVRAHEL